MDGIAGNVDPRGIAVTASSKARAIYKDKGVKIKKSKNKIKVKK